MFVCTQDLYGYVYWSIVYILLVYVCTYCIMFVCTQDLMMTSVDRWLQGSSYARYVLSGIP